MEVPRGVVECGVLVEEGPGVGATWGDGVEDVADLFAGETTW